MDIAAIITAVTGLVAAVTALITSFKNAKTTQAHTAMLVAHSHSISKLEEKSK